MCAFAVAFVRGGARLICLGHKAQLYILLQRVESVLGSSSSVTKLVSRESFACAFAVAFVRGGARLVCLGHKAQLLILLRRVESVLGSSSSVAKVISRESF